MNTVMAIWPIAKWVLQALGFMGPEDKEKEREFQLRLMAAQEENRRALTEAFASFQTLWRPAADRVYVWANTLIALFQPAIVGLVYYDVLFGQRRSIQVAVDLEKAGIPGLFILAIMLFPLYGPALVQGVGSAFGAMTEIAVRRSAAQVPASATSLDVPRVVRTLSGGIPEDKVERVDAFSPRGPRDVPSRTVERSRPLSEDEPRERLGDSR